MRMPPTPAGVLFRPGGWVALWRRIGRMAVLAARGGAG
jgi:hypothetical protein